MCCVIFIHSLACLCETFMPIKQFNRIITKIRDWKLVTLYVQTDLMLFGMLAFMPWFYNVLNGDLCRAKGHWDVSGLTKFK